MLFCLIQEYFEESCLFLILIWLLSHFITCLKNYIQIQLISSFFGPKREIFDFLTCMRFPCFWFFVLYRIFWRMLSIFHFNLIIIWFSYKFNELFPNSVNLTLFRAKKGDFWFFDLYEIYLFLLFLSYTEFFEERCLFFIVIWLLSDFLTGLKNYFQIRLISSFFGPKREIFDFLT